MFCSFCGRFLHRFLVLKDSAVNVDLFLTAQTGVSHHCSAFMAVPC
jgi:hypothetical protein